MFEYTTCTDTDLHDHAAVFLRWDQMAPVLGHPYGGTDDDIAAVTDRLEAMKPADWRTDVLEGWVDEHGIGLIGPRRDCLDMLCALLRHDEGAYGLTPERVAAEWVDAGYTTEEVAHWLTAGVCYAEHATTLQAAGYTPDTLPAFTHWRTDEDVAALIESLR